MLCRKKVYRDELFQLALIISLLRVNHHAVFDTDIINDVNDVDNGTTWRSALSPTVLRSHYVNPKSLDSVLLNYERDLFADLNSLGRYNRWNFRYPDVHTYLLNIDRSANSVPLNNDDGLPSGAQNSTDSDIPNGLTPPSESTNGLELTQEDMDLIEVLWKQDVDLGFSLELARQEEQLKEKTALETEALKTDCDPSTSLLADEDEEGLKADKDEKIKEEEPESEPPEEDIWAGVDYTIDTETGEYVIKGESGAEANSSCALEDLALPLPEFLLDEALRLVALEDENSQQKNASGLLTGLEALENSTKKAETSGLVNTTSDIGDDFDIFADMIQTPQFHHPHHRAAFQSRMPYVRTVSMEQRWQDLANLLSLPNPGEIHPFGAHHALPNYGHPHAHAHPATTYDARGVLLHNATLPTPMGDLNSTMPYGNLGGTISNAVATSMNLTNSSEPMGEPSSATHYKLEPSNDMMYYQNNTGSEFSNNQTDGFLSNLLNDEDLQLMDMAMNEGMYTMRMLESNNTVSNMTMNNTAVTTSVSRHDMERLDTSSDSAVSSMGSERVPSLSDGEWCDAGSDSGHTTNGEAYSQDYQNKYRPFDYSYSNRLSENARMNPVPQKKHLMYGKRFHASGFSEYRDPTNSFQQDNSTSRAKMPEIKYSCSAEFSHLPRTVDHIQHNHTYHLPAENSGPMQRPVSRDKGKSRRSEEEHLSRDEKRARALNIPITVDDIINLPMDEFNERLSKYDLSEAQLSLIRDIRRRGKNKVAAQNCRKRKLDQILSLADEVKEMRDRKMSIMNEHKYSLVELKRMQDKYQQLYRHVFQNLRDADGNQYSPYQYSLQTAADGSILMVPRSSNGMNGTTERKDPPQNQKD